jgi:hypothetical protein
MAVIKGLVKKANKEWQKDLRVNKKAPTFAPRCRRKVTESSLKDSKEIR